MDDQLMPRLERYWRRQECDCPAALVEAALLKYGRFIDSTLNNVPHHPKDRDDLLQVGRIALAIAIQTYDPNRPTAFRSYAIGCIRVAMKEFLRGYDPIPRSTRDNAKLLEFATQLLKQAGQPVNEKTLGQQLRLTPEQLRLLLANSTPLRTVSLEFHPYFGGDRGEESVLDGLVGPDNVPETVFDHLESQGMQMYLHLLPERLRAVVDMYYFQGMTWKQIGKALGVSESRAWQLRATAIKKLQSSIGTSAELTRPSLSQKPPLDQLVEDENAPS